MGSALAVVPATAAPSATSPAAKAGSCKGFKNRIGMTSRSIRIGTASDLSGPFGELHRSAQLATRAYVAYFNQTGQRICGRRLVLDTFDTRTDAAANLSAYRTICSKDFAAVGSMSAFDGGGATSAQGCRLPDLRAASTSAARNACTTCFGVDATRSGEAPRSVPDYFVAQHPDAAQKAAVLYLNFGSVPAEASALRGVDAQRGFTYVYSAAIDVAAFSYGPYVQQLAAKGVRIVRFVGPYQQAARLAQAMDAAGYHPDAYLVGTAVYSPAYVAAGGTAANGSVVPIDFLPLNAGIEEMKLYRAWLARVAPTAKPTATGLYAWSSARLFTTQAKALGARLTRATLNARLRTVTAWTGRGLHAPQAVGTKHESACARLLVLKNGTWVSMGGTAYRCNGVGTATP